MKELIVRPAVLNDIDVLLEFERGMIEAEQPFDDAIRTDEAVRYYDLEEMIVPPHIELVVAELDSELIGLRLCSYRGFKTVSKASTARIFGLYVRGAGTSREGRE